MNHSILICTPVLLVGGTEMQVMTLISTLITAGYRVIICCYYEFEESVVRLMKDVGAEVVLMHLNRPRWKYGIFKMIELIMKLRVILRSYNPDVVHVQYLAPGLLPIVAARLSGIPTIFATVHIAGSIAYGLKAKLLLRIGAKLTTAFICVSRGVEKFWFGDSHLFRPGKADNNRRHFTIYNAIDASRISEISRGVDRNELRKSLGIHDCLVVGIVGRLARQKGHTILLDALAEVVKEVQATRLFIIGDGPDKGELEEKAHRLGLDNYIRWFGALPQEEVFRLYNAMDVFVMPSLYEGFGLTAVEAMAAGLPVVGTKVAGLSEIIENGVTGYLVSVGDSQELSRCLSYLITNPDQAQRMGQEGKHRACRCFSMDHFANSMLFVYQVSIKNKDREYLC
jgi:glycosyltransferase involved in cell wall biosynthesis